LQQVVWNLLSNAIKFTPKGGVIEIRLERSDDRARIVVTDTGQGIDAGLLPHVFDRFRQADSSSTRKHGGLGLGLAIVRHLVELHGGVARAESRGEGQGATFTVELPQQDPEKTSRVAKQTPAARGPGVAVDRVPVPEGVRVLLVEDDTDTRDVLEMALRRCKADVTAVGSAADAVAAIDRSLPDVLVCDIGMPGEDGYALIGKLRARPPERGGRIPAIALTAFVQVEDRQRALRAGFQAHVAKPVDPADVAAVVWSLARRTRGAHVATGPR
jgi:CheY-like chemotaxis protein